MSETEQVEEQPQEQVNLPIIWRFRNPDGTMLVVAGKRRPIKPGEDYHLFKQTGDIAYTGEGESYVEFIPVKHEVFTNDNEVYLPTEVKGRTPYLTSFLVPVEGIYLFEADEEGNMHRLSVDLPSEEEE